MDEWVIDGREVPEDFSLSFARRTITSITQLAKQCAEIKTRDFATDNEEFLDGIRCVAAPIRDKNGRIVASIGLSAPSSRFPKERYVLCGKQVSKAANRITGVLRNRNGITMVTAPLTRVVFPH